MRYPDSARNRVIAYHNDGLTNAEIVRRTKYPRSFVERWVKAAIEGRSSNDNARSGRPPKITPIIKSAIKKKMKLKRRRSVRRIAREMDLSKSTIQRVAHTIGLQPYHQPRKPLLSADHIRRRYNFAVRYANHRWDRTIMSDEKYFYLFPPGNSKNDVIWAENGYQVPPRLAVQKPPFVHVWGAFSRKGTLPLVRIHGNLDAAGYKTILKNTMLPAATAIFGRARWWYQQDGASTHRSALAQNWLHKHTNFIPKDDWPANSPDANSTENLWAYLDDKVAARQPRTVKQLWRVIRSEWQALPRSLLEKLIDSQPKRLEAIRKAKGGHTVY